MAITARQAAITTAGLLLAGVVVAMLVLGLRPALRGDAPPPKAPAAGVAGAPVDQGPSTSCPSQPAVPAVADKDGQFEVMNDLSGNKAGDIQAFIVLGKEAAASARPRDAEVAFVMSCRVADRFRGSGSVESAEARYQLGRHYANLALDAARADRNRGELLKRAELLYADSLRAYRASFGESHEKTRFAADGLARVKQTIAQGAPPANSAQRVATAPPNKPAPARTQTAKAAETAKAEARPATQELGGPSRPKPSFDCRKARSATEKLICSDPELARMDRDLGELHAWAKNTSPDPAAFKRRGDAEWRKRETTCRDRDCLVQWFAQRRSQLLEEIDRRQAPPQARQQSG